MTVVVAPAAVVTLSNASKGSRFNESTRQSATSCTVLFRKLLPSSTTFHAVVACLAAAPDTPAVLASGAGVLAFVCSCREIFLVPDLPEAGGLLLALISGKLCSEGQFSEARGLWEPVLALTSGKLCIEGQFSEARGLWEPVQAWEILLLLLSLLENPVVAGRLEI